MKPLLAGAAYVVRLAVVLASGTTTLSAGWEPTRPVEIVVPAGTGGGGDTIARVVQGIVDKHQLMKQPVVVSNKVSGGGSEAFLELKNARGNPHKLLLTLSNLFTTPLGNDIAFSWRDLTPLALLALDGFALWVPYGAPFAGSREFLDAAIAAAPGKRFKLGGTGLNQEDRLLAAAIEKASGASFAYVPYRGGGEVALQLAARRLEASVNNPIEAVDQWHNGMVRPLCLFDVKPFAPGEAAAASAREWSEVPTCLSQGLNVEYRMLRGLMMPPDTGADKIEFYLELIEGVRRTPEWKAFLAKGAFIERWATGAEFARLLESEEARHRELMTEAGLLRGAE